MPRICEKYRYLKRNRNRDALEFVVGDIRKPFNHSNPEEGGFNVEGWTSEEYIDGTLLPPLLYDRLINRVSPGRYRLTDYGKSYCKRLDPSI